MTMAGSQENPLPSQDPKPDERHRLNPTEWREINVLLDEGLDLDADARASWLARVAQSQPDTAERLRVLLEEHEILKANRFLSEPVLPRARRPAETVSMAGVSIGAYTIQRLIGQGGMGEVWLATRDDGRFEGRCAVKFMDRAHSHGGLAERFHQEGRLLARLTHPNIARLIDAGECDGGRQYLVLEYVDGRRIDQYCESVQLDLRARIRLFLDVVAAVAHAHSHLIIHRDLKPSNVLVTGDGQVKLLDFGIAKLVSEERPQETARTRIDQLVLTPEYAAPEQLLGDMPSTATDVYQLGMLLYELLTGSHPLPAAGTRAERLKIALSARVPRASEFARGSLKQQLRGDLDAILATALQPEAAERYPTAAALAEDLTRYLNREPVKVRRGSPLYQLRRFVARHRLAVAGSVLAVVALSVTSIFATSQARLADIERDRALGFASRNAAVTDFLGMLMTDAADADKPLTMNQLLARSEKLALADKGENPENRAAVLLMIAGQYASLGLVEKSTQLLANAAALVENSADMDLRSRLTCQQAFLNALGTDTAAATARIANTIATPKLSPATTAECLLYLSYLKANSRDPNYGLQEALQAVDEFHAARVPQATEATALGAVGYSYHLSGRNAEANRYFSLAADKYRALGREHGADATVLISNWAIALDGAGEPRRSLELLNRIVPAPGDRDPERTLSAITLHNRARAIQELGRYAEAHREYISALSLAREQRSTRAEFYCLIGLSSTAVELHNLPAAQAYLSQAAQILAPSGRDDGDNSNTLTLLKAQIALADGQLAAARAEYAHAASSARNNLAQIAAALGRADTELAAGDAAAAEDPARRALSIAESLQGGVPFSNRTGLSWLMLGRVLQKQGDATHAHQAFESAVNHLSNTVDAEHPQLIRARQLASGGV